jgi:hypothetical protein
VTLLAHGIGTVRDLPVPKWLFLYGAGVVLVVSFVGLALLWRRPVLEDYRGGRPLRLISRVLLSQALRVVLGTASFLLLLLVFATALVGERSELGNLAPTFVYVVFWLGIVLLSVLFGNIWPTINPWKAAADGAEWIAGRLGAQSRPLDYPERLGCWPAAAGLFCFAALELAYYDPSDPRVLALAIAIYSAYQWIGALLYGSAAWFPKADAFTVYFGLLARIAPFGTEEGEDGRRAIRLRPPFIGLARLRNPWPGTIAFVAVMLGSVAFDGFSRTTPWMNRRIQQGDIEGTLFNAAGLLVVVLVAASLYLLAAEASKALARTRLPLERAFVASLVPIALVYAVSHYFSLFAVQIQFMVPLFSDPFGFGWDLFGTVDFTPHVALFTPKTIWYVQVATLILGHVAALALAHDRALALFRESPSRALRTQYPFLVLMVGYTVGGLYLLSVS